MTTTVASQQNNTGPSGRPVIMFIWRYGVLLFERNDHPFTQQSVGTPRNIESMDDHPWLKAELRVLHRFGTVGWVKGIRTTPIIVTQKFSFRITPGRSLFKVTSLCRFTW